MLLRVCYFNLFSLLFFKDFVKKRLFLLNELSAEVGKL